MIAIIILIVLSCLLVYYILAGEHGSNSRKRQSPLEIRKKARRNRTVTSKPTPSAPKLLMPDYYDEVVEMDKFK